MSVLNNYEYGQFSVQYDRTLTERWQWSSTAGVGRYEVIGQGYRSDEDFVQTTLKRALAEQWSLSAQVGYAYLRRRHRALPKSITMPPARNGAASWMVVSCVTQLAADIFAQNGAHSASLKSFGVVSWR